MVTVHVGSYRIVKKFVHACVVNVIHAKSQVLFYLFSSFSVFPPLPPDSSSLYAMWRMHQLHQVSYTIKRKPLTRFSSHGKMHYKVSSRCDLKPHLCYQMDSENIQSNSICLFSPLTHMVREHYLNFMKSS